MNAIDLDVDRFLVIIREKKTILLKFFHKSKKCWYIGNKHVKAVYSFTEFIILANRK